MEAHTLISPSFSLKRRGQRIARLPLTRIVLAILFVVLPFALASTVLNKFVTDRFWLHAGNFLLLAATLSGYFAYVRFIEQRTLEEFSLSGALQELGVGVLIGTALISVTVGIMTGLGVYQTSGMNSWTIVLATIPGFISSAVLEEVIIRGVIFRILEESLGSWIALAISGALFGILHIFNPGATLLSSCAISLEAGVMLGAAYMITRRLWLCIGLHLAWNFTQGAIFSVAVSGFHRDGLIKAKLVGADWLTGGSFGAEASLIAVIVCSLAGILFVMKSIKIGHIIKPKWAGQ